MKFENHYNANQANDNSTDYQRRQFPRRADDVCMVNVDGHPYPVTDWSQGGLMFQGNSDLYKEGQIVNMILRFKLGNAVEDIKLTGEIVRKGAQFAATKFHDLQDITLQSFQKVTDQSSVA